jgi:hypothetical protein
VTPLEECLTAKMGSLPEEWDQPPELFYVVREYDTYTLRKVPILEAWWGFAEPPKVLNAIAHVLGCGKPHPGSEAFRPPPGWEGAAFLSEGWGLKPEPGMDPADLASMEEASATHTIHAHPARIETRMLTAYLTTGEAAWVVQERDNEPECLPSAGESGGRVPAAVESIVLACQAAESSPGDY